jgi:hypothetical protein
MTNHQPAACDISAQRTCLWTGDATDTGRGNLQPQPLQARTWSHPGADREPQVHKAEMGRPSHSFLSPAARGHRRMLRRRLCRRTRPVLSHFASADAITLHAGDGESRRHHQPDNILSSVPDQPQPQPSPSSFVPAWAEAGVISRHPPSLILLPCPDVSRFKVLSSWRR